MRIFLLTLIVLGFAVPVFAENKTPVIENIDIDGQELIIEFDQPMQTWSGKSLKSVISISPEVDCDFVWEDDTTLTCDTYNNKKIFEPATYYHVNIKPGFLSQEGSKFPGKTLKFNTPGPELQASITEWKNAQPVITLSSTLPVNASDISRYLSMEINGKSFAYSLKIQREATPEYKTPIYEVSYNDIVEQDAVLSLKVKPGLATSVGPVQSNQDGKILHALINETFQLKNLSCSRQRQYKVVSVSQAKPGAMQCDPESPLVLEFSSAFSANSLLKMQASMPAGFHFEEDKPKSQYYYNRYVAEQPALPPTIKYTIKSDRPHSQYLLKIPADSVNVEGRKIRLPSTLLLDVGNYLPSFILKTNSAVLLPGQSSETKLTALNSPLATTEMGQLQISRTTSEKKTSIVLSGPKNETVMIEMPKVDQEIQKNGGISLSGSEDIRGINFGVSYVPFNVISYQSNDNVLVWATHWQSGAPVAYASVEILRLDSDRKLHVVGKAKTGQDGVALFDFPYSDLAESDLMTFVRVIGKTQTVVIPALLKSNAEMNFKDANRYWLRYAGRDEGLLNFGVTELPLYRPGENVKYRFWLRERQGNRLKTPVGQATTLQLVDVSNAKILQTWNADLDVNASASSSLMLSRLLPDGFYCINAPDKRSTYQRIKSAGACFQVVRFDAQPLWATFSADRSRVLTGDKISFNMEGGYFSGGPTANTELHFSGSSSSLRIEDTYPEYREFRFIDPVSGSYQQDGENPLKSITVPDLTDANGKANFVLPLDKPIYADDEKTKPIAFGVLNFSAEVRIAGKASASSSNVSINYAAYPSYVGLKARAWWLPIDKDPELQAVVLSYDGKVIANQPVQVHVYQLLKDNKQLEVGKCDLISGQTRPCAFRASATGYYLFKVESSDVAGTEIRRYIGESYKSEDDDKKPDVSLTLQKASDGKSAVTVLLDQPFDVATVLFTLEYNHIVHHWVQAISGKQSIINVPVKQEWAPGLSLRAVVRPVKNATSQAGMDAQTLDAGLKIDIPRLRSKALEMALSKTDYKPGEEIELHIRNVSSETAFATLSVIDDSVYQQANAVWDSQNPENSNWIGVLKTWNQSPWYGVESWHGGINIFNPYERTNLFVGNGSSQPVSVITRADIEQTGLSNVFDILNGIVSSDGSGLSSVTTDYYRADGFREIQAVEVTGSRIKRVDVEQASPVSLISREGGTSRKPSTGNTNSSVKVMPRMRSQFMDAAYWNPDVVLAAGESRTLKFKLPDNLTQWRVLLWASDDSDGFSLMQTTFKANLPIEVRAGLPSQLFVGDKTSAQISARNQSGQEVSIALQTLIGGAGIDVEKSSKGNVAAYDVLAQALDVSPSKPGAITISAIADSANDSDGLSSGTFVQSRTGSEKITQSGWLDTKLLDLTIPKMPSTAANGKLDLQVSRGFGQWTKGWLQDLQDYPHRCWEQILSRAVGAAYAQNYDEKSTWEDRKQTVIDAVQVAKSFQDENGYFHYFQTINQDWGREPNKVLSAYTLKSFRYLESLGYSIQKDDVESLEATLGKDFSKAGMLGFKGDDSTSWEQFATVAGAIEKPENLNTDALTNIWAHWDKLSWFARSELLLAMSQKPELKGQTNQGIERLRAAGTKRGLRQVINDDRDFSLYMGSNLRDQCAVVGALSRLDSSFEGKAARERLLRGIYDIYAGGTASLDTQSSAQCLMALHEVSTVTNAAMDEISLKLGLDNKGQAIAMAASAQTVNWQSPITLQNTSLQISSDDNAGGSLNYNATLEYEFDLQQSIAKGTGINLQRSYDVLRGDKWMPVENGAVKEGDWIRVRLLVTAPKERYFVAVSDFAPGGFVTRDITLSSVGGANAEKIGGNGSYYFDSRQTGASVVRIYAEYLPAGNHEIYYYAQAVHPGEYFAPPAVAELMYGRASRANTSADRVTVQAVGKAKDEDKLR